MSKLDWYVREEVLKLSHPKKRFLHEGSSLPLTLCQQSSNLLHLPGVNNHQPSCICLVSIIINPLASAWCQQSSNSLHLSGVNNHHILCSGRVSPTLITFLVSSFCAMLSLDNFYDTWTILLLIFDCQHFLFYLMYQLGISIFILLVRYINTNEQLLYCTRPFCLPLP